MLLANSSLLTELAPPAVEAAAAVLQNSRFTRRLSIRPLLPCAFARRACQSRRSRWSSGRRDAFERQCAAKLRPRPAIRPLFAACGFSRPAMLRRASIALRSKNDDLQSRAQEYFVAAQGHMLRGTQLQEAHDAKPCYPRNASDVACHSCAA